ncbi:hypothetical protein COT03_02680 [Candidatus Shapirobacteria bacterium CG07_land_8_20_14_0_80_39_18]|uniref:Uncharacterized protein n=1 Tax=Candidatus Shapirobacteria bacterium CG07_land_8_20_14_0_80_39_18 TaxID=1974882 RepID=A0A2M6YQR5_9BACT|nr:MAG: hypothetical protein COT03_02680 [Candidatus Shapirobacteria bacterium CG07_land_8_20_14_0_80_39_18]
MKRKTKLKKKIEMEKREKREVGEEEVRELSEERSRKKIKRVKKGLKKDNYFIAILVNIVLIYIFNNLAKDGVDFITDRFLLCLPIINVLLGATIFGNFLFLFNNEERFKSLVRIILNILSIAAMYTLYKNFPFVFSGISFLNLEFLVKVTLLLGMVATGVATIIEFFKVVFNTFDWK